MTFHSALEDMHQEAGPNHPSIETKEISSADFQVAPATH